MTYVCVVCTLQLHVCVGTCMCARVHAPVLCAHTHTSKGCDVMRVGPKHNHLLQKKRLAAQMHQQAQCYPRGETSCMMSPTVFQG